MNRILVLAVIAAFLLLVSLVGMFDFDPGRVLADGIPVSAAIATILAVLSSVASWFVFSFVSKDIRIVGVLLGIITGASLVIPFSHALGPMAAVLVGIVAGFSAFMLQKKIRDPAGNRPAMVAAASIAATYLLFTTLVLAAQSPHVWDTGDGIGAWSGTVEGVEEPGSVDILSNTGLGYLMVVIPSLAATWLILCRREEPRTRSQ